jgi:hypothetical protein
VKHPCRTKKNKPPSGDCPTPHRNANFPLPTNIDRKNGGTNTILTRPKFQKTGN